MADQDEYESLTLDEFLSKRNVSREIIQKLVDEKIDISVIKYMSDEDLKKYLPSHGDRLAIKSYATKNRRLSLIEKLKTNFDSFGQNIPPKNNKGNNHFKQTRVIEIGWKLFCEKKKEFRHVRRPIGGTRQLSVPKILKYDEILQKALDLFFPGGVSPYGTREEFSCELQDYKSMKIIEEVDVNKMYEMTGISRLRFYLATTRTKIDRDDEYKPSADHAVNKIEPSSMTLRQRRADKKLSTDDLLNAPHADAASTLSTQPSTSAARSYYEEYMTSERPTIDFSTDLFDLNEANIYQLPAGPEDSFEVLAFVPPASVSSAGPSNLVTLVNPAPSVATPLNEEIDTDQEKLIIHRGHVFFEILDAMKRRNVIFNKVEVEMILPNGTSEKAEDAGGVLRDAISEFFLTFYDVCTMGTELKVPTLRHDFQQKEWEAIGKVIVQSFESQKYFPIKIAPVFIQSCLNINIKEEDILENFLDYVSQSDAVLLKKALEDFESVDIEEILEFCSNYDGKWIPNKNNLKKLITQIAFEELVQKPNYVQSCWQSVFHPNLNHINLDEIYSKYKPTDKNILSMLDIPNNLNEDKKRVIVFLKKFIKESDEKIKSSFLRFCTGSNLPIEKIQISFNNAIGLGRVPVAHTCTNLLELSTTYENFMIFRTEFNNILEAGVWVMDIV